LTVEGDPKDTFIDMQEWMKGVVFVNGFALGKYADIGPTTNALSAWSVLAGGRK
jgi:hypothetical protein